MKVAKNFDIREFVPQLLWEQFRDKSIWFVNPTIIKLAQFNKDFFSEYFGKEVSVIINDWLWGGRYQFSGFRFPDSLKRDSETTFHQGGLCSATDNKYRFKETRETIDPDEIRKIILEHESEFMAKGLTTLESGEFAPTWVHQDCRNTLLDHILIVKPRTV